MLSIKKTKGTSRREAFWPPRFVEIAVCGAKATTDIQNCTNFPIYQYLTEKFSYRHMTSLGHGARDDFAKIRSEFPNSCPGITVFLMAGAADPAYRLELIS
jgi:hypothetical protein